MSGHNKWSQIKTQKAKTDAYKSKVFGKFAKLISAEAKKSKGNISEPGLKAAIEKARAANMPSDNIDRAIKKAGGDSGMAMEEIIYEAYGPGGVALLIKTLTDNRNKAAQAIKHILNEHGFAIAAPGSASWAFKKEPTTNNFQPITTVPIEEKDLEKLDKLVEDLENCEEVQEVFTNAE
ncbi:MAG: transcriptional regulator [Parcubacteria group bacterium GW2011_GWB1_44_7]|nr:MAG: transcriptional regulator [Parcubacteria group bacterium GW2011_GWB1_44_7]